MDIERRTSMADNDNQLSSPESIRIPLNDLTQLSSRNDAKKSLPVSLFRGMNMYYVVTMRNKCAMDMESQKIAYSDQGRY
jgi:hypothetical protein